ncbi:hypothetical protein KIN20_008854 [Parelaphostrongylus tenuis]|uniref:Zc3h12a-like Ribonuclease NYN domain-containing protein n=1 Tax=Parelaphostrongylus tenuis TaxID=148309 RepID=A0AAD5QMY7_PARTN|nr:hypothetical protein KIN20_008854 [Parelaphostrongylus tenuis]
MFLVKHHMMDGSDFEDFEKICHSLVEFNTGTEHHMMDGSDFEEICHSLVEFNTGTEHHMMDESDFEEICHFLVEFNTGAELVESEDAPDCSESTVFIERFMQADVDVGRNSSGAWAEGEDQHIEEILHCTVRVFYSSTPLTSGAFSVTVDSSEFPPTLSKRKETTLLRPVVIDGCAISSCFDKKYSSNWGEIKNTEMVSWHPSKVLRLKPILKCLVHFLLRGHKVFILLPKYYRSAPCSDMRAKVDNVEAFNLLINLNLLQFIEPEDPGHIADAIKKVVDEVDALLVSSPASTVSRRAFLSPFASPSNAWCLLEHPAFSKASERMVTPMFFGGNHQAMSVMFDVYVKEFGTWRHIPEDLICIYELDSNHNTDDVKKVEQQLLFKDQACLLNSIRDEYDCDTAECHGVASVLRLSHLSDMFS